MSNVWFNLSGEASTFIPIERIRQSSKTSADVIINIICVSTGHTAEASASNKRNWRSSNKSSGNTYDSTSTNSPSSVIKSGWSHF